MTHSRPHIHELLEQGGLAPRRDLGQNFVAEVASITTAMAVAAIFAPLPSNSGQPLRNASESSATPIAARNMRSSVPTFVVMVISKIKT